MPHEIAIKKLVPILLAAGLSARMGVVNKMVLPIDGELLIRRTAKTLLDFSDVKPVVVVGHEADRIVSVLNDLPLIIIKNEHYKTGQMSSVTAGLAAAAQASDYMLCLADLPCLTVDNCRHLHLAHSSAGDGQITVPVEMQNGIVSRRGNPIIIPAAARTEIIQNNAKLGCRGLLDKHPELIHPYETASEGFYIDIDTPNDYRDLTGHLPDHQIMKSKEENLWNSLTK